MNKYEILLSIFSALIAAPLVVRHVQSLLEEEEAHRRQQEYQDFLAKVNAAARAAMGETE